MKAILVINVPDDYMGSVIDVEMYGNGKTVHEKYVNKLKLMPQKYCTDADDIEEDSYCQGWNECIEVLEK